MFQDSPQWQTNYYLSKCCHAQIDSELTRDSAPPWMAWHICKCSKCWEYCDVVTASEIEEIENNDMYTFKPKSITIVSKERIEEWQVVYDGKVALENNK